MQSDSLPNVPFTLRQYMRLVFTGDTRPHVQLRKSHNGREFVLCGRVVEASPGKGDAEWFSIETEIGPLWVESRNVRQCSGDGRCSCEVEAHRQMAEQAAGEVSRTGYRYPAQDVPTGDRAGAKDSDAAPARKNLPAVDMPAGVATC